MRLDSGSMGIFCAYHLEIEALFSFDDEVNGPAWRYDSDLDLTVMRQDAAKRFGCSVIIPFCSVFSERGIYVLRMSCHL